MFALLSFRRKLLSLAAVLGLLFAAGCAAKRVVLMPAPNATIAQNNAAEGQDAGVTILVRPNTWNGYPADLGDRVTPLQVTIRNHSGHALRVQYDEFDLLNRTTEQRYAALPPTEIHGSTYANAFLPGPQSNVAHVVPAALSEPQAKGAPPKPAPAPAPNVAPPPRTGTVVVVPDFDWDDYYVAPYWAYAYPGMGLWPYAWAPDYAYYDGYYPYMSKIHLPTKSMLQKAIPEGVVANNGYITGFLYFQKLKASKQPEPMNFQAKLVDARTGQQFGQITIPLQAHE